MEQHTPEPINIDLKNNRVKRQKENDDMVFYALKNNNLKTLYNHINHNEYIRTLADIEFTESDILLECKKSDLVARLLSRNISKNASRQGSKDETEQLKICNITAEKCGLNIKNLTSTAIRPTKDGVIITNDEMKKQRIKKDNCLKSFDGQITGKINGYISAKVAYGSGGHQDNVFEEMDTMAEWWTKYKSETEEILIILIDTDLINKFTRIKEKYKSINNVMVFNHIEFQEYMINSFY